MNHLTKSNSKLNTQIHEVMPHNWANSLRARFLWEHKVLRYILGTGLTCAPGSEGLSDATAKEPGPVSFLLVF